jgi:hypothetical protein
LPQQYAAADVVMPQVKALPALNDVKASGEPPRGATTAIGLGLEVFDPSPN